MKNSIKHTSAFSVIQLTTILFSVFLLSVFLTSASHAQISSSDLKRFQYEFSASIYKQYADSVVYVTGEFIDPRKRELKEYFKIPNQKSGDSIGTGFFISDSGYVLTNAHGVHKSVSAIVELRNSERYNAQVVGFMLEEDLTLLKIDLKKPVKAVEFKEDAEIEVGEPITSISHPHGLKYTCTQGIISAVGRRSLLSDINVTVDCLLQTDMSINPGSSGGPWFNVDGKVVALTTSRRGGSDNISFGVSAQEILRKLPELFDYPHRNGFVRGFDIAFKDGGVFVNNLNNESSAAKAGLKNGDQILTINGAPITGVISYLNLEEKFAPEQRLELTVKNENENEKNEDNQNNGERIVTFTLEKWNAPDVNDALWSKIGLKVRELTEEEFKNCELKSSYACVITEVNYDRFNNPQNKIFPGDVIGKIAGIRPENLSELNRLLARLKSGDKINITILRAVNAEDKSPLITVTASHDSEQSENNEKTDSENKSENSDNAKGQKPRSITKTRIDISDFKVQ